MDSSSDAYERAVDRLLANEQHGVRWGRHFMDVWLYSDEVPDSCDPEVTMRGEFHLWRWRDWIVSALNADKPYDQMIREMIAGDEIAPIDPKQSDRAFRRTIYFRHTAGLADPMMNIFDGADPNKCYRRQESIVPQQALALANSRLLFEQARFIAQRCATPANSEFVEAAYRRVLSRPPTERERASSLGFLEKVEPPSGPLLAEEKEPLVSPASDIGERRRECLHRWGMGVGGLASGSMLARERLIASFGQPHFAPKAKSVICLFMVGGVSHVESFDPKPALNKYAGKKISETPYAEGINKNPALANLDRGLDRKILQGLYPLQTGFKKYGQAGIEVSDWFPHIGGCIDDIAVVRSMWTTDNNHQAQYQFLTGRNIAEGNFPSHGSCCGGAMGHGADYLGPQHAGVLLETNGESPLPFAKPQGAISRGEQRAVFDLLAELNRAAQERYPDDTATEARIKSYELAFRMQMAVPEVMNLDGETEATRALYGLDRLKDDEGRFARQCLLARRFVEKGTRFIQIHHGAGGAGAWDSHSELKKNHSKLANQVDQPIAGLIKDLKQRELFDSTLVVFASEFGRTPGLETAEIQANTREGRDHHPFGFSVWLAGGGIKGGIVHGATDELGFHAVEHRHYVTDVHATILHQLGLEPERLDQPGRKRIEKDYGHGIPEIIA
jgi:hypothetical protein